MSIGGNYYGLVVVDDYSRFTWTLFITACWKLFWLKYKRGGELDFKTF